MEVKIYDDPNPALGAVLASPQIRSTVFEIAEIAQAIYRDRVAKRTGRLAASARPSTQFDRVYKGQPRWVGVLTIGGIGPRGTVDYAAAHEFGADTYIDESLSGPALPGDTGVRTGGAHAAHDLNAVLAALGSR